MGGVKEDEQFLHRRSTQAVHQDSHAISSAEWEVWQDTLDHGFGDFGRGL